MAAKAIRHMVRYSLMVLALVAVVLLVAPFFIDINDYKARIEQEVEGATGRHLSIGEIQASLFPWVGVRLDDVRLANRAGFSEHDFLSVERLHVKLALLPLLNREIEIKEFEVDRPKLYLERQADGSNNWQDLTGGPTKKTARPASDSAGRAGAPASDASPALAALKAEALRLNGGELTWVDAGEALRVSDIDLALDDVQLERPIALTLSARVAGNPVRLDARLGPLGDLSRLDAGRLPVQGQLMIDDLRLRDFSHYLASSWPAQLGELEKAGSALNIRFEQRPDGLRLAEGEALLKATHQLALNWKLDMPDAKRVSLRRLSLIVDGKEVAQAKGSASGLAERPAFRMRVTVPPLQRSWLTGLLPELNAMYGRHPAPWKSISFGALVAGDAKRLDIRDLQLKLDGELVQVSGSIVYGQPDIRLRVASRVLHLDPWLPAAQEQTQKPGKATAGKRQRPADSAVMAEPDLRFLKPWRVTVKVQADALSLHGLNMENVLVSISGKDGMFHLNPMRFNLAGGLVSEKASLNAAVYPARWTESVHVSGVNLGPVLKSLADMDMLEGTLDMDTSLKARGLTGAAVKSLNGRGKVLLRNGRIRGFDIAGAMRRLTRPGAPVGPQETDFAQLSGSFQVRGGVATNRDLFMASPLLRVTGEGTVDLARKQLDYHVKPRVVGTLVGQGDRLKLRKGLTIPLHISGPFDAPKIRPEINAKTLIENAPAVLDRQGGGLKGLLDAPKPGGGKQVPATPDRQIRDAIGGLLKAL